MSDTSNTPSTESPANDDPLQVVNLIAEAMQLQMQSSPAVVEEAHNLEALAESYSSYVTAYTETFAGAWEAAVAKFKAQNQVGNDPQAQQQVANALLSGINAAADEAAGKPTPAKKPQK